MVKAYLKYTQSAVWGVVSSPSAPIVWMSPSSTTASSAPVLALVPQLERVGVWNTNRGDLVRTLDAATTVEVTALCIRNDNTKAAIGYVFLLYIYIYIYKSFVHVLFL